MNDLQAIVEKYASNLRKKKNVVAVAVGHKYVDGKDTGAEAICVFVSEKKIPGQLAPEDMIDHYLDGVRTDVVGRTGVFRASAYTAKERPYAPGASCGHPLITAGTIGGIFKDREGQTGFLSNNHVLAASNSGKLGDPTIQPGQYDGGSSPKDRVGTLKWYRPFRLPQYENFNKQWHNYQVEDSAWAAIDDESLATIDIKDIGAPTGFMFWPTMKLQVQKTGRTTGHTTGEIIGLGATVWVEYDQQTLEFRDQILTSDMSEPGDSGSLLLNMNNEVVGLLFAGSASFTVYNPIRYVHSTYGLQIIETTPLTESETLTVAEDGVEVPSAYTLATIQDAMGAARQKAREEGVSTTLTFTYTVERET